MQIYHIDRTWRLERGTPTQHYADAFCERFTGSPAMGFGPINPDNHFDPDGKVVGVIAPWKGAQWPKHSRALHTVVKRLREEKCKVILFADDLHHLLWAYPIFAEHGLTGPELAIVSNFQNPGHIWPEKETTQFYYPTYPFDRLSPSTQKPVFKLGYVGRWNPKRMKILAADAPPELILLGPQWHNQLIFKHAFGEEGGVYWPDLQQMYRSAAAHISIQDATQQAMLPAISRFGECLASDRPMFIHRSHIAGRPSLNWKPYEEILWSTSKELIEKLSQEPEYLMTLLKDFCSAYYGWGDDERIRAWISQ